MVTAGFIGLGSQGAGMAERIAGDGIGLVVWARRAASLAPFTGRATFAPTCVELGATSDVVGICVTDGAAVREVTLGPGGVLAGMRAGSVLAIHATVGIDDCEAVARAGAERGVRVIDAPVSGGGAVAAEGRLTVYVGGDVDAVEYARPVLETYGNPVFHMGALGAGQRTKLINNALNAAHFALAHDAFAIGQTFGLDRDALGEALRSGSGRSYALEVYDMMRTFEPIKPMLGPIMGKDMGLFASASEGAPERDTLLVAADRFLTLLDAER